MKQLLFLIMTTALSCSAGFAATLQEELDTLFGARYPSPGEPGASVLIAAGDKVLYERQWGTADMATGRAIDADTRFNIASVSKQFTAISALALAEQGRLDLDAPLAPHFPQWPSRVWRRVTLRHLLSQSSGIPDLRPRTDRWAMIFANDDYSMSYFNTLDTLQFEPGSAYDYVNPTFIVASREIARVTGQAFVRWQQSFIFDPLGMTSTCYFSPDGVPGAVAHAYAQASDGRWDLFEYGRETFFATRPDGGIYSTPRDLLRWERGLRDGRLVSAATLAEAYRPHVTVSGSPWCDYQNRLNTSYGLGFFIDTTPGRPVKVYHTGDNGGFQAYVAKYPSRDVVIIVLENRNDRDRWSMALAIDDILARHHLLEP